MEDTYGIQSRIGSIIVVERWYCCRGSPVFSDRNIQQIAGMSYARYQLAFRKYYGTSPYEYLKEMRLNQALFLLKNSDYGIATIAAKVGYHSSGHFAKLFKNAYGMGPREYRMVQGIK